MCDSVDSSSGLANRCHPFGRVYSRPMPPAPPSTSLAARGRLTTFSLPLSPPQDLKQQIRNPGAPPFARYIGVYWSGTTKGGGARKALWTAKIRRRSGRKEAIIGSYSSERVSEQQCCVLPPRESNYCFTSARHPRSDGTSEVRGREVRLLSVSHLPGYHGCRVQQQRYHACTPHHASKHAVYIHKRASVRFSVRHKTVSQQQRRQRYSFPCLPVRYRIRRAGGRSFTQKSAFRRC